MIAKYVSAIWGAIPPPVGNHLWQTTLCVIVAGLLTLVLRKNHARARYWLWLAASVKFLIPFSLLVGIGGQLAWPHRSVGTTSGVYFAMEEVSQPFASPAVSVTIPAAPSTPFINLIRFLPTILAVLWLTGFVVVLFMWCVRWRRISVVTRKAMPLREGREVEMLRRMERVAGIRKRTELRLSRGTLEPGIFGIARPILVWPAGISERLDDAHLEAILAHEVWHVRRRDNLASAVHMAVEAIFWFYPVVWWLGGRLVEERERACDEEVLRLGNRPNVYAEGILKTCEFCVESPLACVSGITGADLKKRVVRIMTNGLANNLTFGRKLLLTCFGIAIVAIPLAFGLAGPAQNQPGSQTAAKLSFDVASVREQKPDHGISGVTMGVQLSPGRLVAHCSNMASLIHYAYQIKSEPIKGLPAWGNAPCELSGPSNTFEVEARMPDETTDEQARQMMQTLLAERFHLAAHWEKKDLPIYALIVGPGGFKLKPSDPKDDVSPAPHSIGCPADDPACRIVVTGSAEVSVLATILSRLAGRPVIDKTGLTGTFKLDLMWAGETTVGSSLPSLPAALKEKFGLELKSGVGPVDVLVIDHVEKPSEN